MGYGPIQIRKFASSRLTSGWPIRRGSSPAKPDSTSRLILNSTKIGLRQGIVGSELALYAHGLDPVTLRAGNDSLFIQCNCILPAEGRESAQNLLTRKRRP
jgi:hypothetical protein